MFPSSGYFKGLNCPYFQSGLCERPYCHFRHVKNDKLHKDTNVSNSSPVSSISNNGRRASVAADSTFVSTPVGPTGSKSFQSNMRRTCSLEEELISENCSNNLDSPNIYVLPSCVSSSSEPTYDPTPKSLVEAVKSVQQYAEYDPLGSSKYKSDTMPTYIPGSLSDKAKTSSSTHEKPVYAPDNVPTYAPSAVPKYNPTPINKLKRGRSHGTDLEYDPVSNFAYSGSSSNDITEVQYVPLKRQCLDEFPSADVDDINVDDFGDSDSAKFSDSDAVSEKSIVDSGSVTDIDNDNSNTDLYAVKTCYRDTSVADSEHKDKDGSDVLLQNDVLVKKKPSKLVATNISTEKNKVSVHKSEKVVKTETKKHKEKTNSTSEKNSSRKVETKSTVTDKSAKHKSSSDLHGKDLKKEVKNDVCSSEQSVVQSPSKISPSNASMKSSSSKSSSLSKSSTKHSSSSSKSSSKSIPSKSSNHQSSKHTSSSSKSSNKGILPKSESVQNNSLQSEDKRSVKKYENTAVNNTSSDKVKKGFSKHHSKSEKENVKNVKDGVEKSTPNNKNKLISKSHEKHKDVNSQDSSKPKMVKKTMCVDLFGQDSDYSDLSDLDEDVTNSEKSKEMSEEQLQQFLEDSDYECDGDTYDECLRIFNEGIANSSHSSHNERKRSQSQSDASLVPSVPMKKRVAHHGADNTERKFVEKVKTTMSPGEVMHNRIVAMQNKAIEAAMLKKAESDAISNAIASNSNNLFKNGRSRLAHKTTGKVFDKLSRENEEGRTSAITVVKGEKRKAHAPTLSNVKRPTIPADFGSKVPSNIRQRYLNLIIDECLKLDKSEEDAYSKAQNEERAVYQRATNKNIYLRVAVNAIKRLRTEVENKKGLPAKTVYAGKQSHQAMLDGRKAITTSYSINRPAKTVSFQIADFSGAELYKRLQKYLLTERQLQDNGYPFPCPDTGGCAKFYCENPNKDVLLKQHERNCCRCGKRFLVFPNGKYNTKEECVYHWGKAWKKKVAGSLETRYTCCGGDLDSEGCAISKLHVSEQNKRSNLSGYMKTIPCSPPIDGDYGVYAMDCEMVYTNIGLELARVTVIDSDLKSVYETLIKPDYPVIDYNTRFSGITEDHMKGVQTTLRDVQAVLLSLFTDRTILLGHSLESDLVAVKLLHQVVVDTSVVFPHRLGPPYKRALRNLMADHLQKIIQNDVGGHDSQEDALACMELMQWKLKEDAKREGRC